MSSFTDSLILRYEFEDNESKFYLMEIFSYWTELIDEVDGSNFTIEIPESFVTDFASVPKIFHSILSPIGKHGKAATVHDYGYWSVKVQLKEDLALAENWVDVMVAKARSEDCKKLMDSVFVEAMEVSGVNKVVEFVMYQAVSIFGGLTIFNL